MVTAGRMAAGQVLCLHYRITSPRNPRHWHWVRIHPGTPAARSFVHSIHFTYLLLDIGCIRWWKHFWSLRGFWIIRGNSRQRFSIIRSDLTITILPAENYSFSSSENNLAAKSHRAAIIVSLDTYTRFCVKDYCNTDGVLSLPLSAAVAILVHQSEL